MKYKCIHLLGLMMVVGSLLWVIAGAMPTNAAERSGSVGIEGTISSPPPTQGATITFPRDGQVFTKIPITVSGICPKGLLVKLFKNNVFGGSTQCNDGSFSIVIDLFNGKNELIARVYDALDQAGPDSNKVTVTFNEARSGAGSRLFLTSNYAKRGANPGETLRWPIILSGGTGPYAVNVDWGDGKPSDLLSREFPGTFTISHVYDSPGVYNIIIKASDKNGISAFLQLVGVGNGALSQDVGQNQPQQIVKTRILWEPAAAMIPLILTAFWLGRRYELKMLRQRIEKGQRPF